MILTKIDHVRGCYERLAHFVLSLGLVDEIVAIAKSTKLTDDEYVEAHEDGQVTIKII